MPEQQVNYPPLKVFCKERHLSQIAVIDYGMGNLRSVERALLQVVPDGTKVVLTQDPGVIAQADKVVFPGQGAIGQCMQGLAQYQLKTPLLEAINTKPFLGICIGLQMLLEWSEEGSSPGLGLVPGQVLKFQGGGLKVPHMGWNQVYPMKSHPLWNNIPAGSNFYFVHSYYVKPTHREGVLAETHYGDTFVSAMGQNNWCAVQFHPEKSADVGLQFLSNFINWNP